MSAVVENNFMGQPKINSLLLITILVMTVCPMLAALYFTDKALATSLNLGFNTEVIEALDASAKNLRTLGKFDPEHTGTYRTEFERIENLKAVYSSSELIKKSIRHSLLIYFSLGVLAALLASIAAAGLLSRRISRSFRVTFDELAKHRERARYLEEITSWQQFAKMLAHEIKNPLTPIEILMTALMKAYRTQSAERFAAQLAQTETMILEELVHLNDTVNKFSDFAKMGAVQLVDANVVVVLAHHVRAIDLVFENAQLSIVPPNVEDLLRAKIDSTLFRQVLNNIVRNGVEANPGSDVNFTISFIGNAHTVQIMISNDGAPVPAELAPRIFDPYITGKSGKENMGLGLAIVRKIMIEHGGDIVYEERRGHPVFIISLPRIQ